jgi:hypothetical protein
MPPRSPSYWSATRAPRYTLLFALPLLLLYEVLAFALSHDAYAGVRNGADVLLKSVFVWLGGREGLIIFGVLLIGLGAALVIRDVRRGGSVVPRYYLGMLAESVAYALAFGAVTSLLTTAVLRRVPLAIGLEEQFNLATQLMISLGAGIYEELLFRVILVAGLVALGRRLGLKPLPAGILATLIGALIFSAFHYVGAYGDRLELGSFAFRTMAGILFSALYLTRGFGITAWTHALYDVFLMLGRG